MLRAVAVDPAAAAVMAPADDVAVLDPHTGGHTVAILPTTEVSLATRAVAWAAMCLVIFIITAAAVAFARSA